jgi:hypothetical protein
MDHKKVGGEVLDWIHLAQDTVHWRICLHGDEPSDSINGGKFLNQLSDYFILKKNSVPWS